MYSNISQSAGDKIKRFILAQEGRDRSAPRAYPDTKIPQPLNAGDVLVAIELLDDLIPCGSAWACSLDLSTEPPTADYADEFIVEDFFGLSGLAGYRGWAKKVAEGGGESSGSDSAGYAIYKLVNLGPPCAESSSGGSESEIESESASGSESESESESQSQSGSQSAPPESGEESSSKSTAIVPASWSPTGYTALFIAECPEVRFDDVLVAHVSGAVTRVPIDPKFLEVCEKNSVRVCGCVPDLPVPVGAAIEEDAVCVRLGGETRLVRVVIRLTGIRKGFRGQRFPDRTRAQFEANERFINSAYDNE